MPWPLNSDFHEAVQAPALTLSDPELRQGQAATTPLGLPRAYSGNFADVYEFRCPATGDRWAVKCFTREIPHLHERYEAISAHLRQAKLPFTVDFDYQPEGVRVRGRWYPVLKMPWVEGQPLNAFVRDRLDKPNLLRGLAAIWARMARRLEEADVTHADLQHGNVLLVPGRKADALAVKLVDYDGMIVPALRGRPSGELGHANYQHPERLREQTYSPAADRFSHLIIATALYGLAAGPELWQGYDTGDNLLFQARDFEHPSRSPLFRDLLRLADPALAPLVRALIDACRGRLEDVPRLEEALEGEAESSREQIGDEDAAEGKVPEPPQPFTAANVAAVATEPATRLPDWMSPQLLTEESGTEAPLAQPFRPPEPDDRPPRPQARRRRALAVAAAGAGLLLACLALVIWNLSPGPDAAVVTLLPGDKQPIDAVPPPAATRPPPVVPFTPADVPDLNLWLEASAGTYLSTGDSAATQDGTPTAVKDGDPVGLWQDMSGKDNHVTQTAEGRRPVLKTNALNGHPVLQFDGIDDCLAGPVLKRPQPYTIVVVVKPLRQFGRLIDFSDDTGNVDVPWTIGTHNADVLIWARGAGPQAAFYTLRPHEQTWRVNICVFNGAASSICRNGLPEATIGSLASGGLNSSFGIGVRPGGNVELFTGEIAAVLIYYAALTDDDRRAVTNYFMSRYGL